jgi:hypothetical protein
LRLRLVGIVLRFAAGFGVFSMQQIYSKCFGLTITFAHSSCNRCWPGACTLPIADRAKMHGSINLGGKVAK